MIRIENLSKTFISGTNEVSALRDVNLQIDKGDIFGVIGLSGAGKSTLVRCINRLEEPTKGEVYVKGIAISKLNKKDLRELRKKMGMIFQHFNLLMNKTVADNIAFPLKLSATPKEKINKKVDELLEVVGLADKKYAYPSQLSGGQKQRVGIARALANDPEILLSDEATSALDPTTTDSILDLLKKINKDFGITIVVITHEMEIIKKICNKVAVMEGGSPVEQGKVIDVFSNPKSETARNFLEDDLFKISEEVRELKVSSGHDRILKISFRGDETKEPLMYNLAKYFDLEFSILAANIEKIQGIDIGYLVIKISGDKEILETAIKYIKDKGHNLEVLQ